MKKILIYLPILFFALWSCDQMEEVYDELDEIKAPYSSSVELLFGDDEYASASDYALADAVTSSDSTYASAIKSDKAFNDMFKAEDYVGKVLADLFPEYNRSSNALVTYNVETGTPEDHLMYLDADYYTLDDADYASVGGLTEIKGYFVPSEKPEDYLSDILASAIANPVEDDVTFVTYKYYDVQPMDSSSTVVLFYEDFETYSDGDSLGLKDVWSQYEETGSREWQADEYNSNVYAKLSSYSSGEANVAWLISPEVTLGSAGNKFTFDVQARYYNHDGLTVLISEDFDGEDVDGATWVDVTSNFAIPTETTSSLENAGSMDLTDYSGSIYVAFKYSGDGNNSLTTTFQIDNILLTSGIEDLSDKYYAYYQYTGSAWVESDDVRIVQPVEYDEMGSPGSYDNFSSSAAPENYLPAYLAGVYPYAQEGDEVTVSYRYYSGSTVTMLDDYKFESGVWAPISTIVEATNQFIHNGEIWLFDPTITYALSADDYQFVVDWVIENKDADYEGYDSRRESYFGVNAKYGNFTIFDDSYENEDFESWEEAAQAAIEQTALLAHIFPEATTQVNGVDMYYLIVFNTYNGSTSSYTIRYQVTKSAPNPEFTYVEGPTPL